MNPVVRGRERLALSAGAAGVLIDHVRAPLIDQVSDTRTPAIGEAFEP